MNEKEHFNLPRIKFHEDFKKKKFDKEMALCLVGELQMHWCQCCDNYKDNNCGCYLPPFKKEMIHKINEHFDNPPLKFEKLCEDEPIFDKKHCCWRYVMQKDYDNEGFYDPINDEWIDFEEDRFFAREVKE